MQRAEVCIVTAYLNTLYVGLCYRSVYSIGGFSKTHFKGSFDKEVQ